MGKKAPTLMKKFINLSVVGALVALLLISAIRYAPLLGEP